jgi:hypothetical protein
MDYFVDLDQTPFNQWQLELLIESFRRHNLQDSLVVCLNESGSPVNPEFVMNTYGHKRVISHRNIGRDRGYDKLNSFYGISWALQEGLLKQPFCQIPLDSVLFSPPPPLPDYPIASYQIDPLFTPELVMENTDLFDKNQLEENWPSAGQIVCYNKFPEMFFSHVADLTERLVFRQMKKTGKFWELTDRLAFNLKLQEHVGQVPIQGVYDYESDMYNNYPKYFVHYDKGFMPIFHKDMFSYSPPDYISFGNPFRVLSENFPSGAFHYMSMLARNYLSRQARLQESGQ